MVVCVVCMFFCMFWYKNFTCTCFLLWLVCEMSEGVVCSSCIHFSFSLQGGNGESGPASFYFFCWSEGWKYKPTREGDCDVREVKRTSSRKEAGGGEGEDDVRVLPVCQLENSWCLLHTPSPSPKDRWVGVSKEKCQPSGRQPWASRHSISFNFEHRLCEVALKVNKGLREHFNFETLRFLGRFRGGNLCENAVAHAQFFFALHSWGQTGGHSSWLMI